MTARIYEQHDAAFRNVSAFVVFKDGEAVAKIAFKRPRDGAGRLYAYVHWIGSDMVRGFAWGFGYDKHSAACADAAPKIKAPDHKNETGEENASRLIFRATLSHDSGEGWDRRLRNAGFRVIQAI